MLAAQIGNPLTRSSDRAKSLKRPLRGRSRRQHSLASTWGSAATVSRSHKAAKRPSSGIFAVASPRERIRDLRTTWGVARESHPAPRIHSPRARYKPCDAVSPGGVEPPSPAVGARRSSIELRRGALSTGIEPASPGRQPGRMSQTRPRACRKYPERESNPRFRCERPASSTARRPGHGSARRERAGRRARLRRLGSNQRLPGNNRSSCR